MRGRLIAGACAAAAVGLLAGGIYVSALRHAAINARAEASAARREAALAQAQVRLTNQARAIGETRERNTTAALRAAEETKDDIDTAPDLAAALDRYRSGLERVRASGLAATGAGRADPGRPDPGARPQDPGPGAG